jgi:methylglutaconyl-CoA hydratase
MNEPLVLLDRPRPGVLSLTLNRPEKRNALNIPMLELLVSLLHSANGDPAVRAIVIRARGAVFCAGLDLKEARQPETSHRSAELIAEMLRALYFSPKVTLAAVQGSAIAGGAGLMSACDLAIATAECRIGYPEVRVGLVAGLVMTFLRRQAGERLARELLLTGESISGEKAEQVGLVTRAVPDRMLNDTVEMMLDLVLKGAPGAVEKTKDFLDRLWQPSVEEDLQRALKLHVEVRESTEAQEGFAAFAEKRVPKWVAER